MDNRYRNYYLVKFHWDSVDMRLRQIGVVSPKMKIKNRENRLLISCPKEDFESVEYIFRKAERNDEWCRWERVE